MAKANTLRNSEKRTKRQQKLTPVDVAKTKEYVQKLSEKQAWLREKFVHFVKLVESHIMERLHEEFDSYFRQWVSVLLEDETINVRLDEEFAPKIEQNGFEMETSDFSGGEKTSFALAFPRFNIKLACLEEI